MPTAEQLARLAAIGRQSVAFVQNQSQIGTISTHHRAAINRIRTQGRQSIVVVDGQIEGNVPAVPGSVSASTLSSSSIRVTCEDVPNENGYKWYRNTTNNSGTATLVGTTGMNVAAFTDSGLSASTTYYYWVKATNAIGDSAFSAVASSATSAAPSGGVDEPFGTYMGHFEFNRNGLNLKLFQRDAYIAPHPDPTKFYYMVSNAALSNFGSPLPGENVNAAYITAMDLPSFENLDPAHEYGQAPQVVAPASSSWVDLLPDFIANATYESGDPLNIGTGLRAGGMTYDTVNNKLWVNFAKFYVGGNQFWPSVAEYHTTTFARQTDWFFPRLSSTQTRSVPSLTQFGDPNGRIHPLAGTPLSAYGDFLVMPFFISNTSGGRAHLMKLNDPSPGLCSISDIFWHSYLTPHPNASKRCAPGGGVFIGTEFVMAYHNGVGGWYGFPDGTNQDGSWGAGPTNWIPDSWLPAKGYKAHPYNFETWRAPTSQMIEVIEGTRSSDGCDYTISNLNHRLKTPSISGTWATGPGPDPQGTTGATVSHAAMVQSICKLNGYILVLEARSTASSQNIVHVWSGEN